MQVRILSVALLSREAEGNREELHMATKTLPCRLHGGTFTIVAKRGRPPVKCGGDYPQCTKAGTVKTEHVSRSLKSGWCKCNVINGKVAHERGVEGCKYYAPVEPEVVKAEKTTTLRQLKRHVQNEVTKAHGRRAVVAQTSRKASEHGEGGTGTNYAVQADSVAVKDPGDGKRVDRNAILSATVAHAMAAKAKLEAQGWTCEGRGWVDPVEINGKAMGGVPWAELIAARGEEMITLRWSGDKLVDQQYSLWDMEQPHKNEMPEEGISSEFDEYTDKELVARMAGQKVTWWNKLGKNKESAFCPDTVKVAHAYNGVGDETPADRIITICDRGSGGFRSFRVGQLLKIG